MLRFSFALTLVLMLAASLSCAATPIASAIPAPCLAPVSASLALAGQEPDLAAALRSGSALTPAQRGDIASLLDALEVARTQCKSR